LEIIFNLQIITYLIICKLRIEEHVDRNDSEYLTQLIIVKFFDVQYINITIFIKLFRISQ